MATQRCAQERRRRIERYVDRIKTLKINRYINRLPVGELSEIVEQAKEDVDRRGLEPTRENIIHQVRYICLNTVIEKLTAPERDWLAERTPSDKTYNNKWIPEYTREIAKLYDPREKKWKEQYKALRAELEQHIKRTSKTVKEKDDRLSKVGEDKRLIDLNQKQKDLMVTNPLHLKAKIALFKLSVGRKKKRLEIAAEYKEKKETQQQDLVPVNYSLFVEIAKGLIGKNSIPYLVQGLYALTGRRPTELAQTAEFRVINSDTVAFTGQLKTRGETRPENEIPVLTDAEKIVDAHKRLKALLLDEYPNIADFTTAQVDNILAQARKTDFFAPAFPKGKSGIKPRDVYKDIIDQRRPKHMSRKAYSAQVLGHKTQDSAESYDKTMDQKG